MREELQEGMLLFLYENERDFNNNQMKVFFNGSILINTGSYMLINKEHYKTDDIFSKIRDLNVGQFILTTEKFSHILRYCISNNVDIVDINYCDDFDKETLYYIEELLSELSRKNISMRLKELFLRSLIYELKYLSVEEDIDISSMVIKSPSNNNVTFYNNNKILFNKKDLEFVEKIILLFQ